LKLRLFGHTLLLYRQVLVFLIALLPLPTPGKKGGWGPAVASPRCEVPRPAKGWLSLVTLFRPTFERYGYNLLLYLTSMQRATFAGISPLQYIAKGFESIELYRDKSSIL